MTGGLCSSSTNSILALTRSDLDDTMERLPKVSYDVLKDKALRELLSSQQLPVSGDRNMRIARHRR